MSQITVFRWKDVSNKTSATSQIDDIFFESSATQSFKSDRHREAFRERWLGCYLRYFPQSFYVALKEGERRRADVVAGYLAGCLVDPRQDDVFSNDLSFEDFGAHLDRFPAHLHINLGPSFRNKGLGGRLISTFLCDVKSAGLGGAHVITSATSRNVSFYQRCGFWEIARASRNGFENVFLGADV